MNKAAKNSTIITDDYQKIKSADVSSYISIPWMTKYEFDQLIGLRTMHLSRGAIPFVEIADGYNIKSNMDLRKIAIRELQEGKLPYIIKRPMPNGNPEYWPVSKLSLKTIEYMIR
jgi:DNA-directed RNA polymerase I, II, and III subunit RPABC2